MQSACKSRERDPEIPDAAPTRHANEAFGHVAHARLDSVVVGENESGIERVRIALDAQGNFRGTAPADVIQWHASSSGVLNPASARLPPGTGVPLRLEADPGALVTLVIEEHGTKRKVPARVLLRGLDGTLDPSFGGESGDHGAGPLLDTDGAANVRILRGKYRVYATHGPGWSLAQQDIEVPEWGATVALTLKRAWAFPASQPWQACDLHVHSSLSFDSHVTMQSRVRSLLAAGIDFAVPTEHNTPGSFPRMGSTAWSPGVEITPEKPSFGHVGVFPWPTGANMPQTVGTTANALYTDLRRRAPKALLVLHHPRFENDSIGMFRTTPRELSQFRYDGLELMNGYDNPTPEHARTLLGDLNTIALQGKHPFITASSDAHNLLYSWAGWPRTYVQSASTSVGDVMAGLKAGRVTLSNGPLVLFDVDGKGSGSTVRGARKAVLRAHVMAASWVNVSRVAFYAGNMELYHAALTPDLHGLTDMSVTWEATLPSEGFVTAIVQGETNLSEQVPFLNVIPLGIAGPVWLSR